MIFTTNKPLSEWGKVLHDEARAAAILDRILERGRLIHLDGPSGRTRHLNLGGGLAGCSKRARISGTHTGAEQYNCHPCKNRPMIPIFMPKTAGILNPPKMHRCGSTQKSFWPGSQK